MTNLFRRKTKAAILLALLGLIPLGFVACSEDYKFEPAPIPGVAFDPSKPVEVAGIFPDSGGYLTPFIIKGSNFGTDTAKIKVYFNGTRLATIVSSNGTTLYGITPKQENGDNRITVAIDGKEPVTGDKTYHYTKVERVSTVAGKSGAGGYVDGNPIDARFNYMYGVNVLVGNNLVVCEGRNGRVRMVSEADNKVSTLFTGANFGHPAVTKDRKRFFIVQIQKPHNVYSFDQAGSWNAKRLTGALSDFTGDIYSCALDDDEKYLYFRDHQGKLGRMEIANPENVEVMNTACGNVDKNVSYLVWSKYDKCFYLSLQNAMGIYKVSHDGKTVEQYAGFNGVGGQDGPKATASFKNPTGMAFDFDGNMYITDSMGFTIRKINHTDGMVTTVAGQYNKGGGTDGLPLEATFSYPYDISVDDDGNFYLIEGWGCTVRKYAIE